MGSSELALESGGVDCGREMIDDRKLSEDKANVS
jgi:hypothetical protein